MNTSLRILPVSMLALGVATLGLAGCGSKTTDSSSPSASPAATSPAATSSASSATGSGSPMASDSASPTASAAASGVASAGATPTATLPQGMTVQGTGYVLQVPSSWRKYTQQGADIQYVSTTPVNKFSENMNVRVLSPAPATSIAGAGPELVKGLQERGATNVIQKGGATVAGEQALTLFSTVQIGNLKPRIVQNIFVHAGKVYTVSLATPPGTTDAVAEQHLGAMMKTWTFTS